jgi:hypothetical protein
MPTPTPITSRPSMSGTTSVATAITTSPHTLSAIPVITTCRACPRSASGAIRTCDANPDRNPSPITTPSADSLIPYSSR